MRTFIQFTSRNIAKSANYYLSFEIKGNMFAANFPGIYGFTREYTYLPLSGLAKHIPGVALVHINYIPIFDMSIKIGYPDAMYSGTEKLMILETKVYDTKVRFAIPYDQLGDALNFRQKNFYPHPILAQFLKKVTLRVCICTKTM